MKKISLSIAAVFICANISFTCWYDSSNLYYPFFSSTNPSDATLTFLVDYEFGLGASYSEKRKNPEDANLIDWNKYLKVDNIEDLSSVIYKSSKEELERILSDKKVLKDKAIRNTVYQKWLKNSKLKKRMASYLIFAKKCEVEATKNTDYWNYDSNKRDNSVLNNLIVEGEKLIKKEKDNFFKDRYAFLTIRNAFFLNKFDLTISLFNKYFLNNSESYIYYRALEVMAGAQNAIGKIESAANYAKVFVKCPDRRDVCVNSFCVTNSSNWNKALSYCKTNEEKVAFHAMRGLQPAANLVEEIERISELSPESALLEIITTRCLISFQQGAFQKYSFNDNPSWTKINRKSELQRLRNVLVKMCNKNVQNNDFWLLATAFSEIMLRENRIAIDRLSKIDKNSIFYQEGQKLSLIAELLLIEKLNNQNADRLHKVWVDNSVLKNDFELSEFLNDVFSYRFKEQGDLARAFLAHNSLYSMKGKLDISLLEALEVHFSNYDLMGKYDKFILQKNCGGLEKAKNIISEMKGIYFLQRNKIDEAIVSFKKCTESFRKQSDYFTSFYLNKSIWHESIKNPIYESDINKQNVKFLYKKYDFLDRDFNLLSYAETLKILTDKASENNSISADYYYLLGIALYNTGVLGWNRPVLYYTEDNGGNSSWWSANTKEEEIKDFKEYEWIRDFYYNPDYAAAYFEKALNLSTDVELKAKALYMLAKVEKTRKLSELVYYWEEPVFSKKYYDCLDNLNREYKESNYLKEVLRECYDFQSYINR